MATINGYTAERMKEIEDSAIIDGTVVGDNLFLERFDGAVINAGSVRGPQGTPGVPNIAVVTSGTRPSSPPEGQMIYETDTDKMYVYYGGVWNLPKNIAGGSLGISIIDDDQPGISAEVDLTGLSKLVTVGAGRLIKVTVKGVWQQTITDGTVSLFIYEGAARLDEMPQSLLGADFGGGELSTLLTPSAGAHTYKARMSTTAGTVNFYASATRTAYILVEDVGGA